MLLELWSLLGRLTAPNICLQLTQGPDIKCINIQLNFILILIDDNDIRTWTSDNIQVDLHLSDVASKLE